jgi:hypothetical protein
VDQVSLLAGERMEPQFLHLCQGEIGLDTVLAGREGSSDICARRAARSSLELHRLGRQIWRPLQILRHPLQHVHTGVAPMTFLARAAGVS